MYPFVELLLNLLVSWSNKVVRLSSELYIRLWVGSLLVSSKRGRRGGVPVVFVSPPQAPHTLCTVVPWTRWERAEISSGYTIGVSSGGGLDCSWPISKVRPISRHKTIFVPHQPTLPSRPSTGTGKYRQSVIAQVLLLYVYSRCTISTYFACPSCPAPPLRSVPSYALVVAPQPIAIPLVASRLVCMYSAHFDGFKCSPAG